MFDRSIMFDFDQPTYYCIGKPQAVNYHTLSCEAFWLRRSMLFNSLPAILIHILVSFCANYLNLAQL